jgi:hypothetical protein
MSSGFVWTSENAGPHHPFPRSSSRQPPPAPQRPPPSSIGEGAQRATDAYARKLSTS